MAFLIVAPDGQIELTEDLLAHIGARPGDSVELEKMPEGTLRLRAAARPTGSIEAIFGMLHVPGAKPITIEEMNEAIQAGWAGEEF